ncbi:NAD(+) diphosphatase [Nocardioides salsibiostraticola]
MNPVAPMTPHLALTQDPQDRIAVRRKDAEWLDSTWADPQTRVLIVSGTRIRPGDHGVVWARPEQAPEGIKVLLGERRGATYFAVIASPELAHAEPGWMPLRGLLPHLQTDQEGSAPLLMHALGLAEWHWATRHCPRCGAGLTARASGHELVCTSCGRTQFPRTDPAVIMLITDGDPGSESERCLLGRQSVWPQGRFSTLAGFCEPGESLEDAVRREVFEEVGVVVGEVGYRGNQPWPLPASLMLGFFGRAATTEGAADIRVDQDEIEEARWFTRSEMLAEAQAGTIALPGGVSISRSLIEQWYGAPLPGHW